MTTDATAELAVRTRWTLARIAELLHQGREQGWLSGPALPTTTPSAEVLASHESTDETPMELAASRLGLTYAELDALWLLACIELDPMVACASQQLFVMNTNT